MEKTDSKGAWGRTAALLFDNRFFAGGRVGLKLLLINPLELILL